MKGFEGEQPKSNIIPFHKRELPARLDAQTPIGPERIEDVGSEVEDVTSTEPRGLVQPVNLGAIRTIRQLNQKAAEGMAEENWKGWGDHEPTPKELQELSADIALGRLINNTQKET